jgi:hypothetical protein
MNKSVKVEPVNDYGHNEYNRDGKLNVTAPHVEGYLFSIELQKPKNPLILTTATWWHLRPLGMHFGSMQRSECYGMAA